MKSSNWLFFLIVSNAIVYWKNIYFEEESFIEQILLRISITIFIVAYFIVRELEENKPKY